MSNPDRAVYRVNGIHLKIYNTPGRSLLASVALLVASMAQHTLFKVNFVESNAHLVTSKPLSVSCMALFRRLCSAPSHLFWAPRRIQAALRRFKGTLCRCQDGPSRSRVIRCRCQDGPSRSRVTTCRFQGDPIRSLVTTCRFQTTPRPLLAAPRRFQGGRSRFQLTPFRFQTSPRRPRADHLRFQRALLHHH